MQKRYIFALVAALLSVVGMAAPRTLAEAEALANGFVATTAAPSRDGMVTMQPVTLSFTETRLDAVTPAFYAFDKAENGGFVIVSADDKTPAILGYTDSGSFQSATTNANFAFWMRRYREQLSAINDQTDPVSLTETMAIAPLLGGTEWDQSSPFNDSLPIDNYDGSRCLTGCVATAAAQVLYKWKYPVHGTGSKSYTWVNQNTRQQELLYADYENTYYDWASMTETYGRSSSIASKAAVAQLMRHLGIATEMMYGGERAGGSGSYTEWMAAGLEEHFGYIYDKFLTEASRWEYWSDRVHNAECSLSKSDFEAYFNADLEAGHPIIMGGVSRDGSGHEFVCDGRDEEGRFHINWGWSGYENGYFAISAMSCQGYNFSNNIDAIFGLRPGQVDTVYVEGIEVTPKELSLDMNGRKPVSASLIPENVTFRDVTWMSTDTTVATISNGVVYGVNTGSAYIIATSVDGGFSDTCEVTVSDMWIPITLVTDTITAIDFPSVGAQYTEFIGLEKLSGAVYAGKIAKTFNAIQLRNDDGREGIYTTASPGALQSIRLAWNSLTQANRTVSIYTSNEAFTDARGARQTTADARLIKGETEYTNLSGNAHFALLADSETISFSRIYVTWEIEGEPIPMALGTKRRDNENAHIIMRNGQLLIVRNGITYHISGKRYE